MLLAGSHLVIATDDVSRMNQFFRKVFDLKPYFENDEFCEFVLPSRFRIAFFKPVGKAAKFFEASSQRAGCSLGITVGSAEAVYKKIIEFKDSTNEKSALDLSGPPKDHPWGEKSFLLIDPDGNRWEITQTPSEDGMLVNRD